MRKADAAEWELYESRITELDEKISRQGEEESCGGDRGQ